MDDTAELERENTRFTTWLKSEYPVRDHRLDALLAAAWIASWRCERSTPGASYRLPQPEWRSKYKR